MSEAHHHDHNEEHSHGHTHGAHSHHGEHGHSHGLVDESIKRSKEGVRAVSWSFLILFLTALAQFGVFTIGNSVALLSDLIHNAGDALTAIPLGLAFLFHSKKGEKWAGYFVVGIILASALVVLYEVVDRFIHPQTISNIWIVVVAGIVGVLGNEWAAIVRMNAGKRLNSPALIADGKHAHADGLVSAGVVVSALLVALGFPIADPLIGLFITLLIVRVTWQSWQTMRGASH